MNINNNLIVLFFSLALFMINPHLYGDYASINEFLAQNPQITRQIRPTDASLNFSGRRFMSIDGLKNVPGINSVQTISLSNNLINRLNDEIHDLENLEEIDLAENKFTTISFDASTKLNKLQKLYLYVNQITLTPNMFIGLKNLKALGLSSNGITQIPLGAFNGLANLEVLQLDSNKLTTLTPGIFNGLTSLRILNLRGNKDLKYIDPKTFEELSNLQEVHLQQIPLTQENKEQLQKSFPQVRFNF